MSYRRAWLLVDQMNRSERAGGYDLPEGRDGGGAAVTPTGLGTDQALSQHRT